MAKNVASQSDAVVAMSPDIELASVLMGGTRAMRAAGKKYLPMWPAEEKESYDMRLSTATLFPAYSRTVKTLTGKPFSKPLTYSEDVPPRIQQWCQEDVDLQGRNLDAFAADVLQEALSHGLSGVLVDYPPVLPGAIKSVADEAKAGVRPYMVQIHPQQILGWRAQQANGVWSFTQLRIMETVTEDDGEFGEVEVSQVRVLTLGAWATYRKAKDRKIDDEWQIHDKGVRSLVEIPFVPVYGERLGFMRARPPMIEMAHLNVEHYQSSSDQQTILHVARVPILTAVGAGEGFELQIGAKTATNLKAGASLAYVEHSGAAIGAGKDSIDALEERMRQAGAELLVITPGNITATQVGTENAVGMCALQRIVQSAEDAIDMALQYMAKMIGEPEGGNITIFNDFAAASLAEASAQILLTANGSGKVSDETLHGELQRRGILAPGKTWVEEKALIDEQGPAPGTMP